MQSVHDAATGSKNTQQQEPSVIKVRKVVNRGYDSDSSSSDSASTSPSLSQRTDSVYSGGAYYSDSVRSSVRSSSSEAPGRGGRLNSSGASSGFNTASNRSSHVEKDTKGPVKSRDLYRDTKQRTPEPANKRQQHMEASRVTRKAVGRQDSSSSDSDTEYGLAHVELRRSQIGKKSRHPNEQSSSLLKNGQKSPRDAKSGWQHKEQSASSLYKVRSPRENQSSPRSPRHMSGSDRARTDGSWPPGPQQNGARPKTTLAASRQQVQQESRNRGQQSPHINGSPRTNGSPRMNGSPRINGSARQNGCARQNIRPDGRHAGRTNGKNSQ